MIKININKEQFLSTMEEQGLCPTDLGFKDCGEMCGFKRCLDCWKEATEKEIIEMEDR